MHLSQIHQGLYLPIDFSVFPIGQPSKSHMAQRQSLGVNRMFSYRTLPQFPFVPCKYLLEFLQKILQLFLLFFIQRFIQSYPTLDLGPPIALLNQIIRYLNRIQMHIGFNIFSKSLLHPNILFCSYTFYPISIIIILREQSFQNVFMLLLQCQIQNLHRCFLFNDQIQPVVLQFFNFFISIQNGFLWAILYPSFIFCYLFFRRRLIIEILKI